MGVSHVQERTGGVPEPLFLTAGGTPTLQCLLFCSVFLSRFAPLSTAGKQLLLHAFSSYISRAVMDQLKSKAYTGPANLDHHPVSPHCLWITPGFASATLNGRIGCMFDVQEKWVAEVYISTPYRFWCYPTIVVRDSTSSSLRQTWYSHHCHQSLLVSCRNIRNKKERNYRIIQS
jgi:hypothetical protein